MQFVNPVEWRCTVDDDGEDEYYHYHGNDEHNSDDDAESDIIEYKLQPQMQFDNTVAGEKLQFTWQRGRSNNDTNHDTIALDI